MMFTETRVRERINEVLNANGAPDVALDLVPVHMRDQQQAEIRTHLWALGWTSSPC